MFHVLLLMLSEFLDTSSALPCAVSHLQSCVLPV